MGLVEKTLAAIRIASGIETGYAQVLIQYRYSNPEHDKKFLPSLHGVTVRRYPVKFDHWGWLEPPSSFTGEHARLAADLLRLLKNVQETSTLAIAARRVNDCYLRDREDDAILDAVIAFETLLSDDEPQEMTHKLALRVAGLLRLEQNSPKRPFEVFRDIKQIYRYRSKLVHGKSKEAEKIAKKEFGGDTKGPLTTALNYLRLVMQLLLQNERYQRPTEIDQMLLIGGNETEAN